MFGQVISSSHGRLGGIGGGGRLNIGGGPPQSHSSSISTQAEDDICKKDGIKISYITGCNETPRNLQHVIKLCGRNASRAINLR